MTPHEIAVWSVWGPILFWGVLGFVSLTVGYFVIRYRWRNRRGAR